MKVREATVDDFAVCLELARCFLRTSSYREIPATDGGLADLFATVLSIGVVFLAEDHRGAVGMIALVQVRHPFSNTEYAEELAWFVHPDCRGGTAAGRLLRAAEEWTRQRNLWCLRMVAPTDQPGVAEFYELSGYQALETSYMKRF